MTIERITAFGNISETGKLTIVNQQAFLKDLNTLKNKRVELTITRVSKKRSNKQNRFWHGFVVAPITYELQNRGFEINGKIITKEDVHEMLKLKFLKRSILNEDTGELFETVGSTANLTTTEFCDLLAQTQMWAATFLQIVINDPIELSE